MSGLRKILSADEYRYQFKSHLRESDNFLLQVRIVVSQENNYIGIGNSRLLLFRILAPCLVD